MMNDRTSKDRIKTLAGALLFMLSQLAWNSVATASPPPNLLFIMTDQQRWDTMSIAGNAVLSTPNLDRLATEGAFFRNFYSSRAICVPARAAILTGFSPQNNQVYGNGDLSNGTLLEKPTFDRILHDAGYYTRYIGKWHTPLNVLWHDDGTTPVYDNPDIGNSDHNVVLVRAEAGQTWTYSNIFTEYLDGNCPYGLNTNEVVRITTEDPTNRLFYNSRYRSVYEATDIDGNITPDGGTFGRILVPPEHSFTAFQVQQTLQALDDAAVSGQPFAITCSLGPPHAPMLVPDPWFSMFPATNMPVPASIADTGVNQPYSVSDAPYNDPALIGHMIQCYYGMVMELDEWVGQLLDKLDTLGLADNTLIVFTSDHGEMLGDHGDHSKSLLFDGACRVPGLLRFPDAVPAGSVVDTPAALIDWFPTILDYLNLPGWASDGYSLRPLIEGSAGSGDHPDFCVAEGRLINADGSRANNKPMYAVRTGDWKLIVGEDETSNATDALYDMAGDPDEMNNLIGSAAGQLKYRAVAESMKARLVQYLNRLGSSEVATIEAREVVPAAPPTEGLLDWNADPAVANAQLALMEVANKGNTVAANIGGRDCRAKADASVDMFFYFNAETSFFYRTPGAPVAIECDYYVSNSPTRVWLRYDSLNGTIDHPVKITDTETGQWKTVRWYVDDALFGDRIAGGTDFYIRVPAGTEGYISRVKVVLQDSADWPPFMIENGAVRWPEASDALGWRLFEIEDLNSSNGWNEVIDDMIATNGNIIHLLPESNPGSFFRMRK